MVSSMTLGLDLQGGSHLLLQVNRESIIVERLKELRRDARQLLAGEKGIGNIITTDADGITVELTDPAQKADARAALETLQTNISGTMGIGGTPELEFGETEMEPEVTMRMKADTAHRFWLGKVNVTVAIARGEIKPQGPVAKILRLVPLTKPVFPRYKALLESQGRQDLIDAK